MILSIQEIIGHFHPLLVHLPIGILLIAVLFQLFAGEERYHSMHVAAGIALFWGMISAIASCISGFLLSKTDDYDESLISKHQWFGISVAVVSILAYFLNKKNSSNIKWVMVLMGLLIIITGHLGGSLTHGSDYLTKGFSSSEKNYSDNRKSIANVQEAVAYTEIIKPILEARCYNCHGAQKQKGKLRLDEPDFILKGGKDGKVIVAGKADESNLIERIFLAKDNEDHMPPKAKPQLSKQDMDLLHWWVGSGASFTKKTNELQQTEKIKPVLLALQTGAVKDESNGSDIPEAKVEKANDAAIQKLKERGVAILPVVKNSNYLVASFVAVDSVTENDLQLLEPLKKQLIWLKLGSKKITDGNLGAISKLSSLTRLYLDHTKISDGGLSKLKNLSQLQYLNLVATAVTAKGLEQLKELKKLQEIFVYQTGIRGSEWMNLKKILPAAKIDTGGYKVPYLESDTMIKKAPVKISN